MYDFEGRTSPEIGGKQSEKYRSAVLYLKSEGIEIHQTLIERLKIYKTKIMKGENEGGSLWT